MDGRALGRCRAAERQSRSSTAPGNGYLKGRLRRETLAPFSIRDIDGGYHGTERLVTCRACRQWRPPARPVFVARHWTRVRARDRDKW